MSNLSRREFLKGAALGAAGVAAMGTVGFAGAAEAEKSGHSWDVPPAEVKDFAAEYEADIVIVGAGLAGMSTALRATELGASVLVLEKTDHPQSRGGHYAAFQSRAMTNAGVINGDMEQCFYDWVRLAGNRCNEKLVWKYLEKSGEAFDWLEDLSEGKVTITALVNHYAGPTYYEYFGTHSIRYVGEETNEFALSGPVFFSWLYCQKHGTQFLFNTPAEQLIKDGDRVVGVVAKGEGGYVKCMARKAVVMATGDISGDPEMMETYCADMWPLIKHQSYTPVGANTGDGQKMAMWAGGHMELGPITTMLHLIRYAMYCFGFLYVDATGKRFMNEDTWIQAKSMRIMRLVEGSNEFAWSIFDSNWPSDVEKSIPIAGGQFWDWMSRPAGTEWSKDSVEDSIEGYIERGLGFKADTLEELAEKIGVDKETFLATVAKYNASYEKGVDEEYHKRAELLSAIKEGPFYALQFGPSLLVAPGGIEINEELEVLDEELKPIPGFYALGNCAGGRYGVDYPVVINGNSHGTCITYGKLLAEKILGV